MVGLVGFSYRLKIKVKLNIFRERYRLKPLNQINK